MYKSKKLNRVKTEAVYGNPRKEYALVNNTGEEITYQPVISLRKSEDTWRYQSLRYGVVLVSARELRRMVDLRDWWLVCYDAE